MTQDEIRDCKRRCLAGGELLGLAELAHVMGITKQACCNRIARSKLPAPDHKLAMSPIWRRRTIMTFLQHQTRR
jgi:hypothetical protein